MCREEEDTTVTMDECVVTEQQNRTKLSDEIRLAEQDLNESALCTVYHLESCHDLELVLCVVIV